jgi:hypothetical protein
VLTRIGIDRRLLSVVALLVLVVCASGLSVSPARAAETCPNEQLRAEQPFGLGLPDCRAYELVSPQDKNGNSIAPNATRAATSGEAVTFVSRGSFSEPKSALYESRYLARRGPNGWRTTNISPPYIPVVANLFTPFAEMIFTSDLSEGVLFSEDTPLISGNSPGYPNLYLSNTTTDERQLITLSPVPGSEPYEEGGNGEATQVYSVGASNDLSHVVFQEKSITTHQYHVYEWYAGKVVQVDVPPPGVTFADQDIVGTVYYHDEPREGDVRNAVSKDGSRVFFTAGEGAATEKESKNGQVYLRDINEAKTVEVSGSQKTNGTGPGGTDSNDYIETGYPPFLHPRMARYWDASADGGKVFFTSRGELTNNANTGPDDNAANLYEYDVETGVLTDLTVDSNPADTDGASVLGLVTASEDGSYVYFVAEGQLAGKAVYGQPNLYLYHAGKVAFIATLAQEPSPGSEEGGDSLVWRGSVAEEARTSGNQPFGPAQHAARVTPDGTQLAFESEMSLTGYDNQQVEPNHECENGKCREIYVYDATTGQLSCASCDPNGAQPIGPAKFGGNERVGRESSSVTNYYLQQNFDDSRLFFESPDPLVQHDSNGRLDVYEYENGHVYPISDVAGNYNSYFMDASENGGDAFIATADQLLPSDTDYRVDIYDVRAGGGYPVSVSPPECNNGDSCKGPVSPQPGVFGPPPSATFSGAGNVAPVVGSTTIKRKTSVKHCKKGYTDRRGVCVKQKARKSGKHSKRGRK